MLTMAKSAPTDERRWSSVANRERAADETFVYAVKTTGVYCRPSCAARLARRENVEFYNSSVDAERAGFRACKRCRPNQPSVTGNHSDVVANACRLIVDARRPLSLEQLALQVGMSPWHFHRVFKSQTGVTPKGYAMAHRRRRVREELSNGRTITSAIYGAGFGSNARFYSNANRLLGMKPTAFRAGGQGATIRFAVGKCRLGPILVAASELGICFIALGDDPDQLARALREQFNKAKLIGANQGFARLVARVIALVEHPSRGHELPLDVQGTAFQQRVWQKLCEIPAGETRTYSQIAKALGKPKSVRAVAKACAMNNLAVAIPCHRVVRTDGSLAGYRWGIDRKAELLRMERARLDVRRG